MSEPRFFVEDHTIHDRVTGKHVELAEAAKLNDARDAASELSIAWNVVIELGAKLKNAEHERDQLQAIAKAATAFVDEQGKQVQAHGLARWLTDGNDFAAEQWIDLVAAVEAAGR